GPRHVRARARADRAAIQPERRSPKSCGVSACAYDSLERCAEWWSGRIERAREQRGRLVTVERMQLDARRAQQLLRFTGAPRQLELRVLFVARASTKDEQDLAPAHALARRQLGEEAQVCACRSGERSDRQHIRLLLQPCEQ